jgi:hypothetical protein
MGPAGFIVGGQIMATTVGRGKNKSSREEYFDFDGTEAHERKLRMKIKEDLKQ